MYLTSECPQEPRKKPTTSTTASLEIAAAHGTTPERPQSPDETADPLRDVPCIRRVLSAVYEGSRGDCREHPSDTVTCCLQCSDGHKCTPVPAPLAGASLALLGSIQAKHEVEKVPNYSSSFFYYTWLMMIGNAQSPYHPTRLYREV